MSVFGGNDRQITSDRFTGVELFALFRESVLDLRDSSVRTRPANVEAVGVFGGVEIRVPSGWEVRINTISALGSPTDRRRRLAGDHETDDNPNLIISGIALFGGIEIRG